MTFKESESVELKAIVTDDIKKEIVAFANSSGGKLYIGVKDDGSVIGLEDPDKSALMVSNMVRDAIKPDLSMFIHYETVSIDDKKIVVVDIKQGTKRPYYIAKKGLRREGVYVRQGYSSVSASDSSIRQMIKETDGDYFEDRRSLEQDLTFESAKKIFDERDIKFEIAQMKTLGLITQDRVYTNLGLLLSDQCVHTIKVAVFEGTTQSEFKDRKEFTGSLFRQMEEAYDFIDFHNQIHSTFERLYRIDRRNYPEVAIREALLNSLIHREYSFSASTFISLYEDRIEFISIGGLVSGLTLEDIMMGISVCRNAKLANVFYRLKLIEAYGTGIMKIMGSYEGTGLSARIEATDNAFKIILPNLNFAHDPQKTLKVEQKILTPQEKVLDMANKKGAVTRKELETMLHITQSTCGRILKEMVDSGLLIQVGKGKNTMYRPYHQ